MPNDMVSDHGERKGLDQVVRQRGPLLVRQAVDIMIQTARKLEAAHAQCTVHGNINPGTLVVDSAGIVHLVDPDSPRVADSGAPSHQTRSTRLVQDGADITAVDYAAPEQAVDARRADHRADIYSLGCTLYFLLTGHTPFAEESVPKKLMAHRNEEAPALRMSRPDVPAALEDCYQKMMAKRPGDRLQSMTDVIALLEASMLPDDNAGRPSSVPQSQHRPTDAKTTPRQGDPPVGSNTKPSIRVRREEREGLAIDREFDLEDLAGDAVKEISPDTRRPPATAAPLKQAARRAFRTRSRETTFALGALAGGLLLAAVVGFAVSRRPSALPDTERRAPPMEPQSPEKMQVVTPIPPARPDLEQKTIFDGKSARGWILCNRAPLPPRNIQRDGLNPHRTGSYMVAFAQQLGDFVLDFDYKLSKGCNSGVFLRVSDLNNPANTGIEVALDDTTRGDDHDSGAFDGLIPPIIQAQNPSGQWNHMTITARGPSLNVALNETEVSSIDLDQWTIPGKRPDGTDHQFKNRVIGQMARNGYLGFQDLGGDCWFRNITLKTPKP